MVEQGSLKPIHVIQAKNTVSNFKKALEVRHKNQIYTSESLSQLSNYEGPLDNIFLMKTLTLT